MQDYPNAGSTTRNQIRCSDCGNLYFAYSTDKSSYCEQCGNIQFQASGDFSFARELSKKVVSKIRIAGQTSVVANEAPVESILARFKQPLDGRKVEDLRIQYQLEWQLWAALVTDFKNAELHMAYVTQMMVYGQLGKAADRYREHRSVMALGQSTSWQASVSDLMLDRIVALSAIDMNREGRSSFRLLSWLWIVPLQSRPMALFFFLFGLWLTATILL